MAEPKIIPETVRNVVVLSGLALLFGYFAAVDLRAKAVRPAVFEIGICLWLGWRALQTFLNRRNPPDFR